MPTSGEEPGYNYMYPICEEDKDINHIIRNYTVTTVSDEFEWSCASLVMSPDPTLSWGTHEFLHFINQQENFMMKKHKYSI